MQHRVLGTAGHIDHGKSALVQALTGTDPDRLKEEKLRGITIELGFADLALDDERVFSCIDVPGHERFVRHMVAGATGIDAVLLVVAADQGIQPQTREHLQICSLLGIERGVVALTKSDLVPDELREVVALELRELLDGSFLSEAPIVSVSAKTGDGLPALRGALSELFDLLATRPPTGIPRLPVDRSFVLKGFGTVVTGTLVSGTLAQGDEVEVQPSGGRGKVRGLQIHGRHVERVTAGRRTAVNLQGLDCAEVPRGSTVTHPGSLTTTRRVWATLTLLPGAPKNIERGPVRFHQGTCERGARVRVLNRGENGALHIELYLDDDTVLAPGDRFILRRPAPVDTIGGGRIVDVRPPRPRDATAVAFAGDSLEPAAALQSRLARAGAGGREPLHLARELGLEPAPLAKLVERRVADGVVVAAAGRWIDASAWDGVAEDSLAQVEAFHAEQPLSRGITREQLRARTAPEVPQDVWRQLLESLNLVMNKKKVA